MIASYEHVSKYPEKPYIVQQKGTQEYRVKFSPPKDKREIVDVRNISATDLTALSRGFNDISLQALVKASNYYKNKALEKAIIDFKKRRKLAPVATHRFSKTAIIPKVIRKGGEFSVLTEQIGIFHLKTGLLKEINALEQIANEIEIFVRTGEWKIIDPNLKDYT
jgi:hypothetical protein